MAPGSVPPSHYDARLAVLEDGARRAERAERDLWTKLREQREDATDELKELRALFDQNMKASAEIITAAREVVKRVDDIVRRQDAIEGSIATYRESTQRSAEDNAKAMDARIRVIEQVHRDRNVRRHTFVAAWSMASGVVGAAMVALFHKMFP